MSALGDVIIFLEELGVYDVILPFLLVFAILFAVLEKTRVFGTETVDGEEIPKKNLNAMVSFVIAFFVIASSQLVSIIQESMGRVVILVFIIISFLLLIGTFFSEKEEVLLEGGWKAAFMGLIAAGIALVFLDSIHTDGGSSWLEVGWFFLVHRTTTTAVSGIILVIVVVGFIAFVTSSPKKGKGGDSH